MRGGEGREPTTRSRHVSSLRGGFQSNTLCISSSCGLG